MGLFLSKLRGLRRDERASIMPLFLFLLIMFAVALVYLIDSGLAIRRKINLQQAADSAAVSQAQWTARSLNILSMNNVAQSQLYTTWSIAFSMDTYISIAEKKAFGTTGLLVLKGYLPSAIRDCTSAMAAAGPFAALHPACIQAIRMGWYQIDIYRARSRILDVERRYRFDAGARYSANAINGIIEANKYLLDQNLHQRRLGYIAMNAVDAHAFGDNIYTFGGSGCSGGKICAESESPKGAEIPVVRATVEELDLGSIANALAMQQFCSAMDFGSSSEFVRRGYSGNADSNWRGWETNRGPWWMLQKKEEYYKHVNDLTDIGKKVEDLDEMIRDDTLPRWPNVFDTRSAGDELSVLNYWPEGNKRQKENDNSFLFLVETIDRLYCGGNVGVGAVALNSAGAVDILNGGGFFSQIREFIGVPEIAVPEPVALKGGSDFVNSVINLGDIGLGALYASQDMNVLAIVRVEGGGKNVLGGNGGAIPSYAYAQAQIYNPTAPDLYTQDWNARLVHASILSGRVDSALGGIGPISSILSGDKRANVRDVLNEMRTQAGPGFTPFIEAYGDISSAYSDQGNASETWGDTFVN